MFEVKPKTNPDKNKQDSKASTNSGTEDENGMVPSDTTIDL